MYFTVTSIPWPEFKDAINALLTLDLDGRPGVSGNEYSMVKQKFR